MTITSGTRTGFTTGTCAAVAAAAAARVLAGRHPEPESIELRLPQGQIVNVSVESASRTGADSAVAAVRKVAGDDPDVTDGALIRVTLTWRKDEEIRFHAGPGVGTVTLKGLQVPPGEPAINPVPRRMIRDAVRQVTDRGVDVEVSVADGEALAEKTFNPRLGIVGGISIIGTTGIVRPYCRKAFVTALRCSIDVARSNGDYIVMVPGNIGAKAVNALLEIKPSQLVEVGNEWGTALDHLKTMHFDRILVAGHPGKLAKFLNDQWDTHSARSDSATEVVRTVATELGVPQFDSPTVDGMVTSVSNEERDRLCNALAERIARKIAERADLTNPPGCLLASMSGDLIGIYGDMSRWKR